ncbi:MAG: hypothetical protein WCK06_10190, partial [Actinomycetota bacterium]
MPSKPNSVAAARSLAWAGLTVAADALTGPTVLARAAAAEATGPAELLASMLPTTVGWTGAVLATA